MSTPQAAILRVSDDHSPLVTISIDVPEEVEEGGGSSEDSISDTPLQTPAPGSSVS